MLDDLKYITHRDKSDALGVMEKQPQQLLHDFGFSIDAVPKIDSIVLSGMGGSALGAQLMLNWPKPNKPLVINRNYSLPPFVNKTTLVIISSYSGNTEEALQALDEALERQAIIVVLAAGAKLAAAARKHGLPLVTLPDGLQPRMAVWCSYRAQLEVLNAYQLIDNPLQEVAAASAFVAKELTNWLPTVATKGNLAKQIAEEIAGKTAVIYAGPVLSAAAYKWKIDINENAKNVAFWNVLPETNHNEMIGWSSHPVEKPFAVIELRSSLDTPIVQQRFDVMNRVLSGKMPHAQQVQAQGKTPLEQLLWTIQLGDFVSIYLALINNVDPTPVDIVESFKTKLS